MLRVERYDPKYKTLWDEFMAQSKNGVFLFYRDYMEYHADRFVDHSLLFFDEDKLVALLPANLRDNSVVSHGGLTFGGLIFNQRMSTPLALEIFDALLAQLKSEGITKLIYKVIPHIYHQIPAEEDQYALFRHGARLFRRDVSSTIFLGQTIGYTKGRKWSINKAKKQGLTLQPSADFASFMAIEAQLLETKYAVRPTHTAAELTLLAQRFPENIKLFTASQHEQIIAGVVMYESPTVAHTQYIAANDEAKNIGALDLVLDYLIHEHYPNKRYFDFGISTEQAGQYLNVGLISNKESYGARATVYDFYELDLLS